MIRTLFIALAALVCCSFAGRWELHIPPGSDVQSRNLFQLADKNHDSFLTENEFHLILLDFDRDHDSRITSTEFLFRWIDHHLGSQLEAVVLYQFLDVDHNGYIEATDFPYIMKFFDRDDNSNISEPEFVIQWYKISHVVS